MFSNTAVSTSISECMPVLLYSSSIMLSTLNGMCNIMDQIYNNESPYPALQRYALIPRNKIYHIMKCLEFGFSPEILMLDCQHGTCWTNLCTLLLMACVVCVLMCVCTYVCVCVCVCVFCCMFCALRLVKDKILVP